MTSNPEYCEIPDRLTSLQSEDREKLKLNNNMHMNRISILLVAALSVLACNKASDVPSEGRASVLNHVSLGVKDCDISDLPASTKSEISIDGTVKFSWSSTDIVGMFPNKGAQAYFEMSSHDGESVAEFDGGGWALKQASTYSVYYPYDYDHRDRGNIPFDYRGQKQSGNDDYSHLSEKQYMAYGMQAPQDGACNYSMERIEAVVIFKLVIPSVISCDKLTFRLADGHKVVVSTRLDISGSNYAISSDEESSQFSLDLEGVKTTSAGQTLYFYAMMPPQDLSDRQVIISVHSTDGDNYLGAAAGKNMLNNHAYQYAATLTSDYASFMEKYGLEDGLWD